VGCVADLSLCLASSTGRGGGRHAESKCLVRGRCGSCVRAGALGKRAESLMTISPTASQKLMGLEHSVASALHLDRRAEFIYEP
jgi:hypothetical protein